MLAVQVMEMNFNDFLHPALGPSARSACRIARFANHHVTTVTLAL
jgi:hypothetical protein